MILIFGCPDPEGSPADSCNGVTCGENEECRLGTDGAQCSCAVMYFDCDGECVYAGTPCEDDPFNETPEEILDAGAPTPPEETEDAGEPEDAPPIDSDRICVGDEVHERDATTGEYAFLELCMDTCINGVCTPACGVANDKLSYLGCTFWATRLENMTPSASYNVTLSSNGNLPIEVEVTTSDGAFVSTTVLQPGSLETLSLTTHSQLSGSGISQKGYYINSTGKITVHQFSNNGGGGDATLLLPVSALGTDYMFIGLATQLYGSGSNPIPYTQ